jgi:hypothetical protein
MGADTGCGEEESICVARFMALAASFQASIVTTVPETGRFTVSVIPASVSVARNSSNVRRAPFRAFSGPAQQKHSSNKKLLRFGHLIYFFFKPIFFPFSLAALFAS